MSSPIRIVGKSIKVVDHEGLVIKECIGNAATNIDDLSLALVTVKGPTAEPWLTIQYEEYMVVEEGCVELHTINAENKETQINVTAGHTAFVEKGTRFQPRFPSGLTKYIPVCLPAFKPERCAREEGAEASDVSIKLKDFHSKLSAKEVNDKFNYVNTIYHMCQKSTWEECKKQSKAYFPQTFLADGKMTHATAVPERLISTANHFYTSSEGDWICLELNREGLEQLGIVTIFEEAMPVGEKETSADWKSMVCPHIYGGIPTHLEGIVTNIYSMKRSDDGTFLSVIGLTG